MKLYIKTAKKSNPFCLAVFYVFGYSSGNHTACIFLAIIVFEIKMY